MPANQRLFSVTSLLLKLATWFCWFIVAVLTLALGAVVVGLGVALVAPAVLTQLDPAHSISFGIAEAQADENLPRLIISADTDLLHARESRRTA